MQNSSRVAPPGTGTYQVPSSYYNNVGGNVSQVQQGVDPLAANQSGAMVNSFGGVQPAGYAGSSNAMAAGSSTMYESQSAMPASSPPQTGNATFPSGVGTSSSSLNNSLNEVPSLQWQQ